MRSAVVVSGLLLLLVSFAVAYHDITYFALSIEDGECVSLAYEQEGCQGQPISGPCDSPNDGTCDGGEPDFPMEVDGIAVFSTFSPVGSGADDYIAFYDDEQCDNEVVRFETDGKCHQIRFLE